MLRTNMRRRCGVVTPNTWGRARYMRWQILTLGPMPPWPGGCGDRSMTANPGPAMFHTHGMHTQEMHAHEMHAREMHALETHAYEIHVYKMHAYKMHAYKIHAHEI
jgi:hypothetical protein